MAARYEPGEGVSFGRIFNRTFGAMKAHAATIFGLAFVFGALPSALLSPLTQSYSQTIVDQRMTANAITSVSGYTAGGGVMLLWLVIYTIALGAIVRVTVAYADDRTLGFGPAAAGGLRVALPLIGLSLLMGFAIGIASLFLLVPGIILTVIWAVAIPARAAEPIGVFAAFGRSRALTKGARWTIFGFGVIVVVVYMVVATVLALVFFAANGGASGVLAAAQQAQTFAIGPTIAGALFNTAIVAVFSTLGASLYVELRNWKDGPQASRLADIFA